MENDLQVEFRNLCHLADRKLSKVIKGFSALKDNDPEYSSKRKDLLAKKKEGAVYLKRMREIVAEVSRKR